LNSDSDLDISGSFKADRFLSNWTGLNYEFKIGEVVSNNNAIVSGNDIAGYFQIQPGNNGGTSFRLRINFQKNYPNGAFVVCSNAEGVSTPYIEKKAYFSYVADKSGFWVIKDADGANPLDSNSLYRWNYIVVGI
jgi:hypothetical protein